MAKSNRTKAAVTQRNFLSTNADIYYFNKKYILKNLNDLYKIIKVILTNVFRIISIITFTTMYSNRICSQNQNESRWHQVNSPINSNLNDLFLFSDILGIACGSRVIKLENGVWQTMNNHPNVNHGKLFALDQNNIWLSSNTDFHNSKFYHYNGRIWREQFIPLANVIFGILILDNENMVLTGNGEAAQMKNGQWEFMDPFVLDIFQEIKCIDDSIYYTLSSLGVFKYKNEKWQIISNSDNPRLIESYKNRIFLIKDTVLYQINSDTLIIHSNSNYLSKINSISFLTDQLIFAAGDAGIILKFANNHWAKVRSPVTTTLNSIVMSSANSGWVVGEDGTILKYGIPHGEEIINRWKGFEQRRIYSIAKVVDDEYGVVAADFNNDGLIDVFTCGLFEKNHLYINGTGLNFRDEASERGVSGQNEDEFQKAGLNLGACAGDFDNDGNIDLYISALNKKNQLYKNLGNGYFVDYSSISGGVGFEEDRSNSVIAGDIDNDGDLDLFITNENTTNRLYLNNGAGIFDEATKQVRLSSNFGGTACSFGDIDNDGDLDLFVSNWSTSNKLYKNLLVEDGLLLFKDITDFAAVGGEVYSKSNGVVFSDIDNDADLDLIVANRRVSNRLYVNIGDCKFQDRTKKLIGEDTFSSYGVAINDFDNDGFKDIYITNVGSNVFLRANNGKFSDNSQIYGADVGGYSTGIASADFDNDGDIDLYVANYIGKSSLFLINKSKNKKYIKVDIEGVENNRSGIGTKVFVYDRYDSLITYSEINGGSGYASLNSFSQTFNILDNDDVKIKVVFPNKRTIFLENVSAFSKIKVRDNDGILGKIILAKNWIKRRFLDHHQLFRSFLWLIGVLLLFTSIHWGCRKYNWNLSVIIGSTLIIGAIYFIQMLVFEYENLFYSMFLPIISALSAILLIHLFYERVILKNETLLERERIREKLSRDLHDDLASALGSAGIYLELFKKSIDNKADDIWYYYNKTENLLSNAKLSITDLIWTIKPRDERLSNLIARLKENYSELFRGKNILFSVTASVDNKNVMLESIVKHNVYLIIKEALNNIIKHAQADKINIIFVTQNDKITITIKDDGIGFNPELLNDGGNGLYNMRKRAEEINALLYIISEPEVGSEIKITLK